MRKKGLFGILTAIIALLIFSGSVLAADVNLPLAVREALKARVLIKIFPENMPSFENYGSGFVAAPGYVVTAYHLIYNFLGYYGKESLVIEIRSNPEGEPVLAEIFSENFKKDLLLLKIKNPKDAAKLGPPAKIAEVFPPDGSEVYSSGFTFSGKFSATFKAFTLGRVGDFPYNGFIVDQVVVIDKMLIPGFSGGPTFNEKGEVVGMNLATGSGISIILPVEPIKEILEKIKIKK